LAASGRVASNFEAEAEVAREAKAAGAAVTAEAATAAAAAVTAEEARAVMAEVAATAGAQEAAGLLMLTAMNQATAGAWPAGATAGAAAPGLARARTIARRLPMHAGNPWASRRAIGPTTPR